MIVMTVRYFREISRALSGLGLSPERVDLDLCAQAHQADPPARENNASGKRRRAWLPGFRSAPGEAAWR